MYTVLLLLLVLSLFFIPEIVRLQESFSKKPIAKVPPKTSIDLDDVMVDDEVDSEKSSLDKVIGLMSGESNGKKEKEGRKLSDIPAPAEGSSLKDVESSIANRDRLQLDNVTWEKLSSSQVRRVFRDAQAQAQQLLKDLPAKQHVVRFALINYINGLGWITKGERKLMSAEEALAYIEQLDINVTQAMLTSEIDAEDFNQWKKVSLGPLSINSRAAAFKSNREIVFNPRLTLAEVSIRKTPDFKVSNKGAVKQLRSRSRIVVRGFVLGKDPKAVAVYRNGRKVSFMKLKRKVNDEGLRTFRFNYRTADGIFTFRAFSHDGEAFEKHYVFLPRVLNRFEQDEEGYFLIPFNVADFDQLAIRNIDTRLDRYFRVGGRGAYGFDGGAFDRF